MHQCRRIRQRGFIDDNEDRLGTEIARLKNQTRGREREMRERWDSRRSCQHPSIILQATLLRVNDLKCGPQPKGMILLEYIYFSHPCDRVPAASWPYRDSCSSRRRTSPVWYGFSLPFRLSPSTDESEGLLLLYARHGFYAIIRLC